MKRILVMGMMLVILATCLAGCGDARYFRYKIDNPQRPKIAPTYPTETIPPTTEAPTTVPPTTEPPTTVPPTEPEPEVPFLQKIYPGQAVYSGPGYNYPYNQTIYEEGTFTITQVAFDRDGHLWGKLKSGIGWVDLDDLVSSGYDGGYSGSTSQGFRPTN